MPSGDPRGTDRAGPRRGLEGRRGPLARPPGGPGPQPRGLRRLEHRVPAGRRGRRGLARHLRGRRRRHRPRQPTWPRTTPSTPSGSWSWATPPAGRWPSGPPVGTARSTPRGFLSLAGFTDLEACVQENLLAGACTRVLGGTPSEVAERYREASPIERLPTGRRQTLVHGVDDDIVPVRQSEDYAAAAEAAGDPVTLVRGARRGPLPAHRHPPPRLRPGPRPDQDALQRQA